MSEAKSAWIVDVATADFEQVVVEGSRERPVVVDFWAPWCQPCRLLGPMLERLAEERAGGFLLAKVNVDEAQELAATFRIEGIPAVIAFRDGKPVLHFVGLLPEAQLRAFVDQLTPSEADNLARQAADLEKSAPARAEALYRGTLDKDPRQPDALLGLARMLLARGQDDAADEVLGRIDFVDEHDVEAERLRNILELRKLAQPFGDESAARRRLEQDPTKSRLRYELGCVLAAAGRYPEALAELLTAAESDRKLAAELVREAMVKIFRVVGVRSALADDYRDRLSKLLY